MGCASSSQLHEQPTLHEANAFRTQYVLGEELQRGHFGKVHRCRDRTKPGEEDTLVVKLVPTESSRQAEKARRERSAWSCLGTHPNIVALLGAYEEKAVHYFLMERCEKSLRDLSKSKPDLTCEDHTFSMFAQCLLGLQHCHSKKIVHRDVKPSNILIDFAGNMRLCDFGVAVAMPSEDESLVEVVGTTPYMSPEMVKRRGYGFKTDVWSFGVTAYAYIYGDYPYKPANKKLSDATDETLANAKKAMLVAIASNSPEPRYKARAHIPSMQAKRFVQALLQRHSEDRPDVTECLQMEIIQKREKNSIASTSLSRRTLSTTIDTEKASITLPTEPSFEEGFGTDASLVLSDNMSKISTTASPVGTVQLSQDDSFLRQLVESRSQGTCASSPCASQSVTLKSLASNPSNRSQRV